MTNDETRELMEATEYVVECQTNIQQAKEILFGEIVKPKLPKDAPEPQGVYYIDRKIEHEYAGMVGKRLPMSELLSSYAKWSMEMVKVVEGNKDNLWNDSVRTHCLNLYSIVTTVKPTLMQAGYPDEVTENLD